MISRVVILGLIIIALPDLVAAQSGAPDVQPAAYDVAVPGAEAARVYYVIERGTTLFHQPEMKEPYHQLAFREKVYVVEDGVGWRRVRTSDGTEGYISAASISNAWLRVSKSTGTVYAYRGTELVTTVPADFGTNTVSDKQQRGGRLNPDHWRTPEGAFFVVRKNANSQYYKALVLNYPTAEDAERGLRQGLITKGQHDAIVRAEEAYEMPPMHTPLGGWIEIHGRGTGSRVNWTQGCVAVADSVMDELWNWVEVGTPVLIEP